MADATAHMTKGTQLEADGRRAEAIAEYTAAAELEGTPEQLFRLAWALDLEGQDREAERYYEQLCRMPNPPVNALVNLAIIYEDRGDGVRAERCLAKVLEADPRHSRARLFSKDAAASRNMIFDEDQVRDQAKQSALLDTPVTDFELSVRARNCLKKLDIRTLGDLLRISEAELLAYKNFGETSLVEIRAMLATKGLRLGQSLEGGNYSQKRPDRHAELVAAVGEEVVQMPVSSLQFSVRSRKALQLLNIHTLGDLATLTEAELMGIRNFGATSLEEIKARLADHGLGLRRLE